MIAKATSISHGINAICYITGESRHKKRPELITYVKNNLMDDYIGAQGIWDMMKHGAASHPHIKNNVIRIELSPSREHTAGFSIDDWARLWDEFVEEFDNQTLCDLKGNVYSHRTRLKDSMATVWLHEESRSGVPHLHAVVCRVDRNGNVNNDHDIHIRAHNAAERVALKRGWTTAREIHKEKTAQAARDCEDILRDMETFSLRDFLTLLSNKYEVKLRCDREGRIHGYSIRQGNTTYRASEIGAGRHFTASNLEKTWWNLHPAKKPSPGQSQVRPKVQVQAQTQTQSRLRDESDARTSDQSQGYKPLTQTSASVPKEESAPLVDYTTRKNNTTAYDIPFEGRERRFYIPDDAASVFEEEFDYRTISNWDDLTRTAVSVFVGLVLQDSQGQAQVATGGGVSSNDLPRRRKEEDDRDWARRCARYAAKRHGIERKYGLRR